MSTEAMKLALEAAYLAGWNASGEGYNAEYPFGDHARNPEEDAAWIKDRDNALREALAQPQQEPVAWEHHAKKLTQWLHCMSYNDSYFGEPAGLVKQVTGALNRLIGTSPPAQPQQEPVAWMHEWEDGEKIPMLKGRDDRNQDKPKTVRPLVYGDTSPQPAQPQQEPKKDLMFSTVAMQERHDERIGRIVNTLDQVKQEQQPAQPQHDSLPNGLTDAETSATASVAGLLRKPAQPQQEPVDFASLLREAEEIVQSKPTWKRFIDATPLANDIAVWMTVFAQDVALRNAASTGLCHYRKPLTDEQVGAIWNAVPNQAIYEAVMVFARAIEAAHGIKGDA